MVCSGALGIVGTETADVFLWNGKGWVLTLSRIDWIDQISVGVEWSSEVVVLWFDYRYQEIL